MKFDSVAWNKRILVGVSASAASARTLTGGTFIINNKPQASEPVSTLHTNTAVKRHRLERASSSIVERLTARFHCDERNEPSDKPGTSVDFLPKRRRDALLIFSYSCRSVLILTNCCVNDDIDFLEGMLVFRKFITN